jgi:mannose-6-phosphate isomerase-like protein (cupin superfamily)
MEIVNLNELFDEFKTYEKKVVKKIPIMTEHAIASITFIPSNTETAKYVHTHTDEINFIANGNGQIEINGEKHELKKGMILIIPKKKTFQISSSKYNLIIISLRPIKSLGEKAVLNECKSY